MEVEEKGTGLKNKNQFNVIEWFIFGYFLLFLLFFSAPGVGLLSPLGRFKRTAQMGNMGDATDFNRTISTLIFSFSLRQLISQNFSQFWNAKRFFYSFCMKFAI